ncbi:hypothetical protein [Rhizobium mayense]|uniref:Integrase n=1 Tax=Rhizobium mayense TaxID=1312184 RepID=A0ABT7K5F1_9HYPH|nr:hypothetical protein [Rhizobium mayense]MDL2403205.1 hypothetical protein [Rhizobium mayense]
MSVIASATKPLIHAIAAADAWLYSKRAERGKNHVIVFQQVRRAGLSYTLPVLYLIQPLNGGRVSLHRVDGLLDLLIANSSKSNTWKLNYARAFGLMADCATALMSKGKLKFRTFGKDFANALRSGTIQVRADGTVIDELDLFWHPRSRRTCKELLKALTRYLEKAPRSAIKNKLLQSFLGPEVVATTNMAREALIRSRQRLLSHLDTTEKTPPDRASGIIGRAPNSTNTTHRFPTAYVWPMLFEGFTSPRGGTDETAQLLAHFQILGGCRSCEPFHIWVQDVQFIEGRPVVFLHHPEESDVEGRDGKVGTRSTYLKMRHTRMSRNRLFKGKEAVGWKGLEDEKIGAVIQWLPIPGVEERVARLLVHYLSVTRPRLMKRRRALGLPDHPYLLVSSGQWDDDDSRIGAPYTRSAYYGAWGRAVGRIAKIYKDPSLKVEKKRGTTTQAGRHFYGSFLKTIGADNDLIRRCMRHLNERSQIPYTKLTPAETNEILQTAAKKGLPAGFSSIADAIASMKRKFTGDPDS